MRTRPRPLAALLLSAAVALAACAGPGQATRPEPPDLLLRQAPSPDSIADDPDPDGLILSDALGMAAVGTSTQGDALVGFLRAGGDLGIVGPGGSVEGRRSVRAALDDGTLSQERLNEAAMAVLDTKGVDPCIVDVGPVASVSMEPGPADPPVINPTEEP